MTVSTDDVIAYYKFDTGADDAHGSNDGTVYGATLTTGDGGVIDEAYSFATNDYIDFSSFSGVKAFQFWVKTDASVPSGSIYECVLQPNRGTVYSALWLGSPAGEVVDEIVSFWTGSSSSKFYYWDTTDVGFANFNADDWYHIVITWDSSNSNYRLYINGSDKGLANEYGSPTEQSTWSSPTLGRRSDGVYFDGDIDEFALFNRALTGAEVSELYNSGDGLQYPFGSSGFSKTVNGVSSYSKINGTDATDITKLNGVDA